MSNKKTRSLWKFNRRSGIWDHARTVTPETESQWLAIFTRDEPNEHFLVRASKPSKMPEGLR